MTIQFFPIPFILGLGVLIFITLISRKRQRWEFFLHLIPFGFYVLLVIGVTIFPIPLLSGSDGVTLLERTVFILSKVQWVPFHYFSQHLSRALVFEVFGNILLTIPFGFGINFLLSIKGPKILSLALSVGFLIEIFQLVVSLMVGVAYRTVDVSDVILNASGVIIGYILFRFIAWLYVSFLRMFNLKPEGLFEYVFQMTKR